MNVFRLQASTWRRDARRLAVVLFAILMVSRAAEAAGIRVAIVPSAELARDGSPLVDLVDAGLARAAVGANLVLLNRAEIADVLSEQQLALTFDGSTPDRRRTWGRILRAELLVLLEVHAAGDDRVLEAICIETRHGVRTAHELAVIEGTPDHAVRAIVVAIMGAVRSARHEITHVFAVPPFESEDLLYHEAHLQRGYARLVESTLAEIPGVVVVELEEARTLARELALSSGVPTVTRPLPFYVRGRYRHRGRGDDRRVEVAVELRRGEDLVGSPARSDLRPSEVAPFLHDTVRTLAAGAVGRAIETPDDRSSEVDILAERSQAFHLLGEHEHAIGLAEAALLLDDSRHRLHLRIVDYTEALLRNWQDVTRPGGRLHAAPAGRPERELLRYILVGLEHLRAYLPYADPNDRVFRVRGGGIWFAARRPLILARPFQIRYDWSSDPLDARPLMEEVAARQKAFLLERLRPPGLSPHDRSVDSGAVELIEDHALWSLEERLELAVQVVEAITAGDDWLRSGRSIVRVVRRVTEKHPVAREQFIQGLERADDRGTRLIGRCMRLTEQPVDDLTYEQALAEIDAICLEAEPDLPPPSRAKFERFHDGSTTFGRNADLRQRLMELYGVEVAALPDVPTIGSELLFTPIELTTPDGRAPPRARYDIWTNCGDELEVIGSWKSLFMMRKPGVLEPIEPPAGHTWTRVADVRWDGRYVWIADREATGRIDLLEASTGRYVTTIAAAEGLPPISAACRIEPLGEGRAIVVGRFRHNRAWVADVTVQPGRTGAVAPRVDVFHEARQAVDNTVKHSKAAWGVDVAFTPTYTFTLRSEAIGTLVFVGKKSVLDASRHRPSEWNQKHEGLLVVDPATHVVRSLPSWAFAASVVPAEDRIYLYACKRTPAGYVPIVREVRPPWQESTELFEITDPAGRRGADRAFDGRRLLIAGTYWTLLDIEQRSVLHRSLRLPPSERSRSGYLTWSAQYGFVLSASDGTFQRIQLSEDAPPTAPVIGTPVNSRLDEKRHGPDRVQWVETIG